MPIAATRRDVHLIEEAAVAVGALGLEPVQGRDERRAVDHAGAIRPGAAAPPAGPRRAAPARGAVADPGWTRHRRAVGDDDEAV